MDCAGKVLAISGSSSPPVCWFESAWSATSGKSSWASIVGAGTGIGYASLPNLINSHTPARSLSAANGINTLARSLGSTLASAVGGRILASITMSLGGVDVPSRSGYRLLFVICAASAIAASAFGLIISRRSDALGSADQFAGTEPIAEPV